MCGIAGLWSSARLDATELRESTSSMTEMVRHRGPDAAGVWCDGTAGIALGHRRLAIIDLSAAAGQPMVGASGARIVFNGEIYNHVELRRSLIAEGVRFRTSSDTEVILALYEKLGVGCVDSLRGMFAFAIWDAPRRRLVLARDRIGKKPLYYLASDGRFAFASEIKALRVIACSADLEIDRQSLSRYLSYGFISGPATIYRGILQLPPGSILVADAPHRARVTRYWPWPRGVTTATATAAAAATATAANLGEQLEAKLTEAVRLRLRADVPVAAFLSGGIDSGLIAALATRELGGSCSTFTVGFDESRLDERPLARLVARQLGTDHHDVALRPDIAELIPAIARCYDQPFGDASAVPSYCLAQFVAQRGIKVVLNGDGGDELFGGYRRAQAAAWLSRAHDLMGHSTCVQIARLLERTLPAPRQHRSRYAFAHRFVRGAASGSTRRLLVWSTDSFTSEERTALGFAPYDERDDEQGLISYLPDGIRSPLGATLALDLHWMLPYGLLVKMDIATMAHGLEARSPLLDQELIEWVLELPDEMRVSGLTTKPLLRPLARKYLPAEVARAPKRGFEAPVFRWLTHELFSLRDDLLFARDGLVATITDRRGLERFVRHPPPGDSSRWAQQAWILLMLAAWDRFANVHTSVRADSVCAH